MKIKNYKTMGFTMIELLLVITIAGILAAIGMPSYQTMVKNTCMTTSTNALITSLQLARSEAIKNRAFVTIQADSATADNLWGLGWTVYRDSDNNSALTAGEEIRIVQLTCGIGRLTIDANDNTAADPIVADTTGSDISSFSYDSSGFINDSETNSFPITINICDDRVAETGRQISINALGRPSTNSTFTQCL